MVRKTAPVIPDHVQINIEVLPKNTSLHRIHPSEYAADIFNPTISADARFSPIQDTHGNVIPTLYAATTFDCAAMETVFHDVPYTGDEKIIFKESIINLEHSTIVLNTDLKIVDLSTKGLRKLGIKKTDLIETESDHYPFTRQVAEKLHTQYEDIQGLKWVSRQDDKAQAIVLFGDRIAKGDLQKTGDSKNLIHDSKTYSKLLDLAEEIDALILED